MNTKCKLCQQMINYKINLAWIFSFKPIKEKFICKDCYQKFEFIQSPICEGCGRKSNDKTCLDCVKWEKKQKKLLKNRALLVYQNQATKEYFNLYKFIGDYQLRKIFQNKFEKMIMQNYPLKQWIYVPIPVNKSTQEHERMFNQVVGLIENLPYVELLAVDENLHQIKQVEKNRIDRIHTPQPFKFNGKIDLKGKNILLVDDVYTTGTTLYHAQQIMFEHGAKKVHSITLAR